MANGYLGKISAVVAANTGDYVRKLNDSASTTKSFAKAISSDLSRASRDATKSIESILTPIQRVERALQNAASQKLAFRGFDGAIQTVEQLRKVIEKVADRPVELQFLLKQSGLKTLEQIRQTIGSISEKNLQLALSVGGVEGLRRLREDVREINGKLVNVKVQTDAAELDRLIEVFSQIAPETIRKLKVDVESRQLEQAVLLNKQLVSVASEITSAYGLAKQQFAGFAAEVQVALGPGLRASDSGLLKLLDDIQSEIPVTEAEFNRLSQAAQAAAQAISRVGEADAKARSLSGGQELAFSRRGDVSRELSRAEASQQSAAGLSNAADLFARQKAAAAAVVVELGKMEAAELQLGGGARVTTKEYERQLAILRNITAQIERSAAAQGNADRVASVITGSPQNFDQGRALQSQLEGQIASLNRSQRQDFKELLTQASDLSAGSDPANLEKYLDVLQKIQFEVAKKLRVNIETDRAEANAERLKSSLEALRQNADFVITGRPQSIAQVQAELNKVLGTLDQLDEDGRKALGPSIERVNIAVNDEQLDAANEALDELKANASQAITVRVTTNQAMSRIDAINAAWDQAIRQIPNTAEAIDAQFSSLLGRVASLGIADRLDLDPLIAAFRDSVRAGEPLIEQFQRLLALRGGLDAVESQPGRNFVSRDGNPVGAFGPSLSPVIDELGSSIASTRRQIEQLDEPLRAQLGPEIDRITIQFQNMARAGIGSNADAARRLAQQVAAINAAMANRRDIGQRFSERFGGAGQAGLSLGVDQRSLQAIGGQIEFVQERLSRLGAEARGPTLQALQRFRETAQRLFDAGTIDTESGRAELAALRRELVDTLSVAGGGSRSRLRSDINRAGDVARGGVDRFSLGLQQAAFAVDDFFSVTGGFEQRIRAVGNNLTQLGFIIGGTAGLVTALVVSLGAQAAIGIAKFVNGGRTAEDMAKTLNDSLARQKTLADELADSFSRLGDAISEKGFSAAAKEARSFTNELENIIKKQREAREERSLEGNPRAIEIGGRINALNRRLRDVTDVGQAAAIRDEIAALERERRRLRDDLPARPEPTLREVRNSVGFRGFNTTGSLLQGVVLDTLGTILSLGVNTLSGRQNTVTRVGQAAFDRLGEIDPSDRSAILAQIDARIREINPLASRDIGFVSTINGDNRNIIAAREERARLLDLRARFENSAFGEALREFIATTNRGASELESAQRRLSDAVSAGTPGARESSGRINAFSQQIADANTAIRTAIERFNQDPTAEGAAEARDGVLRDQRNIIRRAEDARSAAVAAADRIVRERTINPERSLDTRVDSAIRTLDELGGLGGAGGALLTRIRQIEAEREVVRDLMGSATSDQDPILVAAEQQLNAALLELTSQVRQLDETLNSFEQREARRLIGDPERGRQLAMTPQERVNEQLNQGLNDIAARFGEIAEGTTGLVDFDALRQAQGRFIEDQARQVAPLIFGFRDERLNAALQGPSRAALNVADAGTTEGARELNRLLRGDDPAKDVNLVELQKQSELLQGLLDEARKRVGDPIVELRG